MKFKAGFSVFLFSIFTMSFVGCFGCKKNATAGMPAESGDLLGNTKEVVLEENSNENENVENKEEVQKEQVEEGK